MFAQLNHIQWLMAEFLRDMVRTIQETQIKTIEIFYRADVILTVVQLRIGFRQLHCVMPNERGTSSKH